MCTFWLLAVLINGPLKLLLEIIIDVVYVVLINGIIKTIDISCYYYIEDLFNNTLIHPYKHQQHHSTPKALSILMQRHVHEYRRAQKKT